MATFANLIAIGFTPIQASAFLGVQIAAVASGTGQADAVPILSDNTIIAGGELGMGYRLPMPGHIAETYKVINRSGAQLMAYPPSGGKIAECLSVNQGNQHENNISAWYQVVSISPPVFDVRFGT